MSIHKSQGQTLERVKVDLGKVFEKGLLSVPVPCYDCSVDLARIFTLAGQAYVALSRATSLEGLQVLNFEPSKVQPFLPLFTGVIRQFDTLFLLGQRAS